MEARKIMKKDLNYICETMGNLSGIPVRLYAGNDEIFFLFYGEITERSHDHI